MDVATARQWVEALAREHPGTVSVKVADEMAKLLSERVTEAVAVSKFIAARKVMADAFLADEGLRIGYVANVAMLLHDRYGITDHDRRNAAAVEILDLIFAG